MLLKPFSFEPVPDASIARATHTRESLILQFLREDFQPFYWTARLQYEIPKIPKSG
jgi:hypothetical protein